MWINWFMNYLLWLEHLEACYDHVSYAQFGIVIGYWNWIIFFGLVYVQAKSWFIKTLFMSRGSWILFTLSE